MLDLEVKVMVAVKVALMRVVETEVEVVLSLL